MFTPLRNLLFIVAACLAFSCSEVKPAASSDEKVLSVMFYNVENLFDTEDDPKINDDEFTPQSEKQWTKERYQVKLQSIAKVIQACDVFLPDVIGLCEIENIQVLQDLIGTDVLKGTKYRILHADSPDDRGIDVALLYKSDKISLEIVELISSKLPAGDRPNTRLVLHAAGQVGGKNLHFYINHWPSRGGGQAETEPNRLTVANNVYQSVAKLIKEDRESLVVLMGDFNDHPNDKSLKDVLRAGKGDGYMLTNLMWDMEKNDLGTYAYKGDWGCLDQFLVSPALQDGKGVDVVMESVEIVKKDWMLFVNDKGVASPNRTYGGNNYYGGFSDHLPIYMKISLP